MAFQEPLEFVRCNPFPRPESLGTRLRHLTAYYRGRDLRTAGLLEGDPETVLEAVAQHAANRKKGVTDDINVAIFYCGGGAAGADGIGFAMALQLRRLLEGCRTVVGISTGSHTAAAHVTKQLERGCWSYRNVVTDKAFINFWRGLRGITLDGLSRVIASEASQRHFIDVEKLIRVYSGREPAPRGAYRTVFDLTAHTLIIPVTKYQTGECVLITFDAKRPHFDQILRTIHASCALPPPLYRKEVSLPHAFPSDVRVVDGGVCDPIPIRKVEIEMECLGMPITHVIVVLNFPLNPSPPSRMKKLVERLIALSWPIRLRESYERNAQTCVDNLNHLRTSGTPYMIVSAIGALGTFTNDRRRIKSATLAKLGLSLTTLDKYAIARSN